ncbi:MAG: hypothetical protein KKB70_04275 [Proteobacteria bacterium]|nr:hypothetical protein [Pseudomonadota bacterium]MBU1612361.1 hypothetical protein [Pseudomonadota bacterium]
MEHRLRRCPNCLGEKFFAEPPSGMVFFSVREDGSPQRTKPPFELIAGLVLQEIFCTGCGWHGRADELLPPGEPAHG